MSEKIMGENRHKREKRGVGEVRHAREKRSVGCRWVKNEVSVAVEEVEEYS